MEEKKRERRDGHGRTKEMEEEGKSTKSRTERKGKETEEMKGVARLPVAEEESPEEDAAVMTAGI